MPTPSPKLGIPIPATNEGVNLTNFTAIWNQIDAAAQKNITISNAAPSSPADKDLWIDTSSTPYILKEYDATNTTWHQVGMNNGIPYTTDTSNTANTVTAAITPAPTTYTDGLAVCVKIANTTTGAATLNVNGLGAIAIKNGDGSAVGAGDLVAGVPVTLRYVSGSPGAFIASGSGGLSGTGNATAADVRAPKTFTSSSGKKQAGTLADNGNGPTVNPSISTQTVAAGIWDTAITVNPVTGTAAAGDIRSGKTASSANGIGLTGTLADNGNGPTITPGTSNQTLAPGIWDSTITVQGDANLIAANILKGVSIFGVAGTVGRSANGSFLAQTTTPTTKNYYSNPSGSTSLYGQTVSGLSFTPRLVVAWTFSPSGPPYNVNEIIVLQSIANWPFGAGNSNQMNMLPWESGGLQGFLTSGTLTSGGFTIYVLDGNTYNWYAFE